MWRPRFHVVIAQSDSELSSTLSERALFVFDAFACPIASLLFYFFYFFFIECQLFVCESVLFLVFFYCWCCCVLSASLHHIRQHQCTRCYLNCFALVLDCAYCCRSSGPTLIRDVILRIRVFLLRT